MPDLLRVTQPLIGQENMGKVRPQHPSETNIQNIPDPSRVTQTNGQEVFTEREAQQFRPNLSSNFDAFLQMLKNVPDLSQSFHELVFSKMGSIVNSGIEANVAKEIAQFMEFLNLSEASLLDFIKNQSATTVKFSGPIFDVLRQVLGKGTSPDLKNAILEFIRTYDSASSSTHVMKNIMSNLKNISQYMPSGQRATLLELMSKLSSAPHQGSNQNNLNILKTQIFPFLSSYIGITKDFSTIRDVITLLTLNLVKYEMGTNDHLMSTFQKLMGYPEINAKFANFSSEEIENMLFNSKFAQTDTKLIDAFVKLVERGVNGQADKNNIELFDNILKSVLINKSVYMPLQHIIIPANIDGQLFFSEIWIDPDADDTAKNHGDEHPASKYLIKFDIQDVGFFEIVMLYKNGRMDMMLFYPRSLSSKSEDIKRSLDTIMKNNNITFNSFAMHEATVPIPVSDVFSKIQERKDTINVKV